jgi:hypothetical protein
MKDQNAIATTAAGAGSNALKGDLATESFARAKIRRATPPRGGRPARATARLDRRPRGADATRLQNLTNINQFGVQASALPSQVQAGLYGTGTSASVGQGGNQASAAKTPGFWDTFLPALVGGASQVASAGLKH